MINIPIGSKLFWKDGTEAYIKIKSDKTGFWWESLDPQQQEKEEKWRWCFRVPDETLLESEYYCGGKNPRFILEFENVMDKNIQKYFEDMEDIYEVEDELTGWDLEENKPTIFTFKGKTYIFEITGAGTFVENGHEELKVEYLEKLF